MHGQPSIKICPYEVSYTIELKNTIASYDNNGIQRAVYLLTSVSILWGIGAIFCSSIIVVTTKDNFLGVPLLHSVSDVSGFLSLRARRWRGRVFHSGI